MNQPSFEQYIGQYNPEMGLGELPPAPKPNMEHFGRTSTALLVASVSVVGGYNLVKPERADARTTFVDPCPTIPVPQMLSPELFGPFDTTSPRVEGVDLQVFGTESPLGGKGESKETCSNTQYAGTVRFDIQNNGSIASNEAGQRYATVTRGIGSAVTSIYLYDGSEYKQVPCTSDSSNPLISTCPLPSIAPGERKPFGIDISSLPIQSLYNTETMNLRVDDDVNNGNNEATNKYRVMLGVNSHRDLSNVFVLSNQPGLAKKLIGYDYPVTIGNNSTALGDTAPVNPSVPKSCSIPPTFKMTKQANGKGYTMQIKPAPSQTVSPNGNGASTKASERAKAARVMVNLPKDTKFTGPLPKASRKIGSRVYFDQTRVISNNRPWNIPLKVKTNKTISATYYAPIGTLKNCIDKSVYSKSKSLR